MRNIQNKIIALLFLFLVIPFLAFATRLSKPPRIRCYYNQISANEIIYEAAKQYEKDGKLPKIDINSPTLDYNSTLKQLNDNKCLNQKSFKVAPKCDYDFKHCPNGTKTFPDYKNIVYCKYHGSEELGILPSNPKEIEEEEKNETFLQNIGILVSNYPEYIFLGIFILITLYTFFRIKLYKKL